MLDINALFPQIAELKQKTAKATASSADSVSFDDILKSSVAQTQAAESDSLTMEDLIEMVTVPEDLKAAVTDLSEDSPKTDQELKAVSKKIHVFSLGLVDVINNSVNANEVAQAEMDLQFLMIGTFQLTKSYGYASAADDLLGYWKKLDIRSQSFSALINGLIDFIKDKKADLNGLTASSKTPIEEGDRKKIIWEIQYAMWEKISTFGVNARSKDLLQAFDDSNQMASAKVNIKGTPLDSLVETQQSEL